jgi:hypothetical protein
VQGAFWTVEDYGATEIGGTSSIRTTDMVLASKGSGTPPILKVSDAARVAVERDFGLGITASVRYDSSEAMELGGNFDNSSTLPSGFDWTQSGIVLNGAAPQVFEVAGIDVGPCLEGFGTNADAVEDTAFHGNFSLGSLVVEAGVIAEFGNTRLNTVGTGLCDEALYVGQLRLESGSVVTLNNCKIYYDSLTQEGDVSVNVVGCGALVPLCGSGESGACGYDLHSFARFQRCFGTVTASTAGACCAGYDADGDKDLELDDYRAFFEHFDGP